MVAEGFLAGRGWRTPRWRRWWLAAGVSLLLGALTALALWRLRSDALEYRAAEVGLLSLALSDEIERDLVGIEDAMRVVRDERRPGRPVLQPGDAADAALRTRAELMPLVDRLWVLDAHGRPLVSSQPEALPAVAGFAPALAALKPDEVALSRPFGADPANQRVALALRLDSGWLVAALPANLLLGALGREGSSDVRMAVLRNDGARLAGVLVATPRQLDEARVARRLARLPPLHVHRFSDGSDRLVSLRHLPRQAVDVVLTRDLHDTLAAWQRAVGLSALGWALLTLLLLLSVLRVQRAAERQAQAQAALQAQRGRASRLESLGGLAGGVAHDFNNVLAALLGHAEIAHDLATPGSEVARRLDLVLQAGDRAKALVERILSFGRGGAHASEVFALTPVVEQVLQLLAASLPPGLVIEQSLEAPQGRLRGDPTQAFEAVMNLCTNALQAMPQGGRLRVALWRERLAAPRVLSHSELPPGDYLALSVADSGEGIDAVVLEHLFEPFFTTRAHQHGTGLGLAVVHGVVAELAGGIDVQSTRGEGACFTLYLPASDEPLSPGRAAAPVPVPPPATDLPLLVLDDDAALVELTREMLTGLGYPSEGCTDPAEALRRLREVPCRYALLVTDEVMPGLTGTALTEALRTAGGVLPVLLVSGYGGAQLAERAHRAGITRVLAKPLRRAELELALAELLN